jgi:glycosyltransferase involved in cell wall biosynthesis
VLQRLGVTQPYVLYVGSEQERKNLPRLVEAVAVARQRVPELRFVKVGGHQTESGRAELLDCLQRHGMAERTSLIDRVSDSELISLYRGACVTALVSLREGFGFPALEAMAAGSPVVVSNRDSLPEVTGGKALVADPLDVSDIAQAIERIALDEDLMRRLRQEGPSRAALFTWEKTTQQYVALYNEALTSPCA